MVRQTHTMFFLCARLWVVQFSDCCVALPHDAMVCLQFVIVIFPDHTHYFMPKVMISPTYRQTIFIVLYTQKNNLRNI